MRALQADNDARALRKVKAENKELGMKQEDLVKQHHELLEKVARMKENLEKMTYAEANESKLNFTTNQLNK